MDDFISANCQKRMLSSDNADNPEQRLSCLEFPTARIRPSLEFGAVDNNAVKSIGATVTLALTVERNGSPNIVAAVNVLPRPALTSDFARR
jgi:hypothetical protein